MVDKRISPLRASYLLLAAVGVSLCGFVGASSPVIAQAGAASSEVTEEVIVHGPLIVRVKPMARSTYNFRNPELITVSRAVSYADLDLSKPPGAAELKKRIGDTAQDVCQELNKLYPKSALYVYENTNCVKKATDDATAVADQLIAAAKQS